MADASKIIMTTGDAPATPASGTVVLYPTSAGKFAYKTDEGTVFSLDSNYDPTTVAVDSSRAILATELKGQTLLVSGAYTPMLPTAVAGYHCIFEATTAAIYSVALATDTDVIELDGTALTAGYKITSDGTKRARVHIRCDAAGTYIATALNAVFTDGGA